jgi:hypothetical protein
MVACGHITAGDIQAMSGGPDLRACAYAYLSDPGIANHVEAMLRCRLLNGAVGHITVGHMTAFRHWLCCGLGAGHTHSKPASDARHY